MSSTALDLDLATLVGELEDVPCESAGHGHPVYHDQHSGPAATYVRFGCPFCGLNIVKAYCARFVEFCRGEDHGIRCQDCRQLSHAPEAITILGPVNGRAS